MNVCQLSNFKENPAAFPPVLQVHYVGNNLPTYVPREHGDRGNGKPRCSLKSKKKTYIHRLSESKRSRTVPTGDYSRLSPNEKALNGYLGI